MILTFEIRGRIPSKKNSRRNFGRAGPGDKANIASLQWQIAAQWRNRPPIEHPALIVALETKNTNQDEDNMYTTLLDCLVKCRVLIDDSSRHNNGPKLHLPMTVCKEPLSRMVLVHDPTPEEIRIIFRRFGLRLYTVPPEGRPANTLTFQENRC